MEDDNHKMIAEEPDFSGTYTIGDYMRWAFEGAAELINGKIFKMSPGPTPTHQFVLGKLFLKLSACFENKPCQVFLSPLDVYLTRPNEEFKKGKNVLQPDLLIICDETKLKKIGCIGAPDLVLEIISPSTRKRDLQVKYDLYEEFGVKEYWIVFPETRTIAIHVLDAGKFKPLKTITDGEVAQSVYFPDLRIELVSIFPPETGEDNI